MGFNSGFKGLSWNWSQEIVSLQSRETHASRYSPDQIAYHEEYYLSLCCSTIKTERNLFKNVDAENCALLGYYAASSGNLLPTFRGNLSVGTERLSWNARRKPETTQCGCFLLGSLINNNTIQITEVNYRIYMVLAFPQDAFSLFV